MPDSLFSRRQFVKAAGATAGSSLLRPVAVFGQSPGSHAQEAGSQIDAPPDYTLTIAVKPVEIAPNRILSTTAYNGQFPGPLLRLKEGQQVTLDIHNETDRPEQLHWHGQTVSTDVDGAAEEGTPYIAPHGSRRISFVPKPSGLRFYHTHVRAKADLSAGQYSGLVGPVYIEPKNNPGDYDREVFLTLKEFEPTFSRGGDMAMDFLSPATVVKNL
jgi:FtsP/CotA-like multicopper oxidase with cupredoxin domain